MKLILIAICSVFAGCASEPLNPEGWMAREKNSCLPLAISMAEALKRQGVQARVLRYSYAGKRKGHAITAYLYPPGANQLWTYDFEGSWRTRAYWNDPAGIARAAEALRARDFEIINAEFYP